DVPTSHPLLRRLVRGELREQRAVRGRDPPGAHALFGGPLQDDSRPVGARAHRRVDRALQVYHPDFFGGTWVLYPDPVDFRNYEIPDVYSDTNAFVHPVAEWMSSDVPAEQEITGQPRI